RVYDGYGDKTLRVCLLASYAFDASVQQIFGALLQGHSLYISDDESRKDGESLLSFYNKYQIDVSDGTPTHLRLLLESIDEVSSLDSLSSWILAGETFPKELAVSFYTKLGERTQLYNFYGPTETCVDSTSYKVFYKELEDLKRIPIGKPLPNERVYVTDSYGSFLPIGVIGELCIAGSGLARRYTGDQSLTTEKFVSDWIDGETLVYRTGDMVRWLPDGNLEYQGRQDAQVKIRGYRIELSEIETHLNKHPSINHALVSVQEIETERSLVCYYQGEESIVVSELREYLSSFLPDYMIPSYYMHLESFPQLSNGKIDRNSLPELSLSLEDQYVAPTTEVQEKLVVIYSDILKIDRDLIGVNSSFIDLGGHSLKMVFLVNAIKKEFGV
ncbi:non-ribosomal peptide synthetase, partial [Tenacibaculum halocynthiae]|uniref:non-ribosomal peptide synthetase n=1 Tax=Tenacibaculum halocynthiae TaxID=1254437 RepID=UPI0038B4A5AC